MKELRRMSPVHQITMLKFIKNLSMLSTTLDSLQNSNGFESSRKWDFLRFDRSRSVKTSMALEFWRESRVVERYVPPEQVSARRCCIERYCTAFAKDRTHRAAAERVMVLRIWFESSRKWDFLRFDRSRSVKTSMALEFWRVLR
jgi:hypothetical protein